MWVLHDMHVYGSSSTYMFIHAGLFHILFNMLALWMFGTELERIWGTRFFLKFYFVTGIGAAVPDDPAVAAAASDRSASSTRSDIVGASGAIYGLLLAYALYFPDRKIYMYIVFPDPGADLRPDHGRDRVLLVVLGERRRRQRDASQRPARRVRLSPPTEGPENPAEPVGRGEVPLGEVAARDRVERSSTCIQAAAATVEQTRSLTHWRK